MRDKTRPSESSGEPLTESEQSKAPKKLFFNTNVMDADEIADSVIDELFPELREEGAE
jgi:hypothetical protein